jgi:hypothetical protein
MFGFAERTRNAEAQLAMKLAPMQFPPFFSKFAKIYVVMETVIPKLHD